MRILIINNERFLSRKKDELKCLARRGLISSEHESILGLENSLLSIWKTGRELIVE